MSAPWRKVEKASKGTTVRMSRTSMHSTSHHWLTLECGHKTSRPDNGNAPPKKVRCKKCEMEAIFS